MGVYEQNARNIWRKIAFTDLLTAHKKLGVKGYNPYLEKAIDIFRERMDFTVESSVPVSVMPSVKLRKLREEYNFFFKTEEQRKTLDNILVMLSNTENAMRQKQINKKDAQNEEESADAERVFNQEQVQEQEQE